MSNSSPPRVHFVPSARYYIIFIADQHKGKRQNVPQQGNILAISIIAKSDCTIFWSQLEQVPPKCQLIVNRTRDILVFWNCRSFEAGVHEKFAEIAAALNI